MLPTQTLSSIDKLAFYSITIIALISAMAGCRQQLKQDNAARPEGERAPTEPATDSTTLVPVVDLDATETQKVKAPWSGDFNELGERRYIRALVVVNETSYFVDRGEQRGYAYESLAEFEKSLRPQATTRHITTKIAIIPTTRDRLLPALAAGYGEIAIGNLTITPKREELVDFSDPLLDNVKELIVSGPSAPAISSIDELSGKEVHVRASSSYHESLKSLNKRLRSSGKAPVKIRFADELLEDEDIMQEVDAGIIQITVIDSHIAKFWSQVYDRVNVHDDLALREGGRIAWAMRKNSPEFKRVINDFVRTRRAGTLFGNLMLKRYLGRADRLKNPIAQAEMQRFRDVVGFFRKYGNKYDLPWLLIAAQGYQESGLDQSKRSPAGAVGIMQVKPSTAADPNVGIRNIENKENNIHAGVRYLRFVIDQYFKDEQMDRLNKGLFALASYNAGPARVAGLRRRAEAAGLDPNKWFNNVEFVAAREIGRETVDYVSNIYKYYIAYRGVVDVGERRTKARSGLALLFILLSLSGMVGIARANAADTLSITRDNHNNRIGAGPHYEDKLPPDVIARSQEPRLWDQYKWYVVAAISLIAAQTGLIGGLLAERRRLRRAEEGRLQLAAIVESSSDAIIGTSLDGRILSWNLGGELIYGYTVAEMLGREISIIVPPDRREEISENLRKLRSGEHIENFETVRLKKDGTCIDVSLSASPIKDMRGRVIAVATIARDITERKRSEQELHRLTARLLNLQDDERRRLALELHDVTAQNLFAINMNLSRLQRGRMEPSEAQEILTESRKLGHQSLQEIRTLSYLLHPPMLDQAGLVDALKWYVGGFIKRSGINVEVLTIHEIGRLPAEIEMALFRIVQESLTNIRRHSGSNSANLRLEKDEDQVILQIRDQGRGMLSNIHLTEPDGAESLGVGLPGMRQRLHQLGGSLIIESSNRGVVVTAIVPITKGTNHDSHLVS